MNDPSASVTSSCFLFGWKVQGKRVNNKKKKKKKKKRKESTVNCTIGDVEYLGAKIWLD